MKNYRKALKIALTSTKASRWIKQQNDKETRRKENNPLRPLIVWSHNAEKMADAQRDVVEYAVGLGKYHKKTNLGWSILAMAFSFEEQAYAVVLENINGMHMIVYPNGQYSTHKAIIFRAIGDWLLAAPEVKQVPRVPAAPVVTDYRDREPDPFESAPVRISGLYERGQFYVN